MNINLQTILNTQLKENYAYPECALLLATYLEVNPLSLSQIDRALQQLTIIMHHYLSTEGWYTPEEFQQEVFSRLDTVTKEYVGDFDPISDTLF